MQRNIISGSEFLLYNIDNEPVAYCTNSAIKINNSLTDITTKDSNSWTDVMVGVKSWSIEFEGLVSYGDDFNSSYFINKFKNSEPFFIKFGVVQNNFTHAFFGEVHIESIDQTADDGEVVSYSGSLKGIGNLSFTDDGSPEQSGYIKTESDPVFRGSPAYSITNENKANWTEANNKIVKEIGFTTVGSITTLKMKFNDGNIYSANFDNPTASVDLSGYYNKSQIDAQNAAAQVNIDNANTLLYNIASDNKLSPSEKLNVLKEWQIIQDEKPILILQAVKFELETIDYDVAYNELELYVEPLLLSMSTTSNIEGFELRNWFRAYYDQKLLLLKKVNEASIKYTDDSIEKIAIGGRNYHFNGDHSILVTGSTNQTIQSGNYPVNSELAISFYAKSVEGINRLNIEFDGQTGKEFFVTSVWTRYTCILKTGVEPIFYARLKVVNAFPYRLPFGFDDVQSNSVEVKNIMVTLGNKPMDFVHAPEDFLAIINQAKLDAENAAKVYTDAQDALTKAYADALLDGVIDDIEQINLDLLEDYLQSAKDYADAQALNAKILANAYADGLLTDFEQQIIDASTANLAAAKAYSDAQREQSELVTNALIDGKIDDIEAILIENGNDNLAAAKAYSDAQDLYTKTLSDSYTDGKISDEEAARITAVSNSLDAAKAYTVAQRELSETLVKAYSDGIVSDEEVRAIADAQAKLDLAKSYADQKVLDAKTELTDYVDQSIIDKANEIIANTTDEINVANTATLLAANTEAENKATAAKNAAIASSTGYTAAQIAYSEVVTKAYADGIVSDEEAARILQAANNLQAAKDDSTVKANAAAEYGIAAQNLHNALVGNLKGLAYEDKVEAIKLGGSILTEGGYLKGDFFDVLWLKANIIEADEIVINGGGATVTYVDGVASSTYSNAVSTASSDATSKANSAYSNAVSDAASDATTKSNTAYSNAVATAASDATSKANAAISSANSTSAAYTNSQIAISEANTLYSASTTASSLAESARVAAINASATYSQTVANEAASQAEINASATSAAQAASAYSSAVAAANSQYSTLTSSLKSMAYIDLDNLEGITTVDKGGVTTIKLDAAYVKANVANIEYLNSLDIVSKSIRTATSGQRVEILQSSNNMVFYDDAGNAVVKIDDDIDSSQAGTPLGGMRMDNADESRTSYCSANGFFSNGGGMQFLPGSSGIPTNASLVGLLFDRNSASYGISAAVVGRDGTTSGASASYAGYFIGKVTVTGDFRCNGNWIASNGDVGQTTNLTAGGARMRFVNGLYVGYW